MTTQQQQPRRARSFRERRTPPSPSSSSSNSAASATNALATQQIAGNFQSFLTLLTTQLQNQNPLDPLDTNQFTQQLVEFAGVQQQLNTNDSLATLVSLQQTAQSTQALGFVGKTAVVERLDRDHDQLVRRPGISAFPQTATSTVIDHQQHRADRLHRQLHRRRRQRPALHLERQGQRRHAMAGRPVQDDRHRARQLRAMPVAVSTADPGVVSSVDLTQTPPLLTINGQTYTVNQIKAIVS